MGFVDSIPLWMFFVGAIPFSLVFLELGFRQGKRRRLTNADESDAPVGAIVGGVLALLAFMLAFTFSLASSRFDERRHLVLDEANAIGTLYLRADFVDEPGKSNIRLMLRRYIQLRLDAAAHPEHIESEMRETGAIQQRLWSEAVKLAQQKPTPVTSLFISSLNDVIDFHEKRVITAFYTRVPETVWAGLLVVTALAMLAVGFYVGQNGKREWVATLVLITSFSTVLLLVADLDRPYQGFLRVSQKPMFDTAKQIGAQ